MPDMDDIAANAYPIAFGDFKTGYRIADSAQMVMLRDPYTLATSGKVRYLFTSRVGGTVVMPEAIKKLKCSV
jgi:HK97 family phage major capsid protein